MYTTGLLAPNKQGSSSTSQIMYIKLVPSVHPVNAWFYVV